MFSSILVPVDLNHPASWEIALPKALELAKQYGSTLHLVDVVPDFGMAIVRGFFPEGFEEQALEKAAADLEIFAKEHIPDGVKAETHLAHGAPSDQILQMAEKLSADLILMASHQPDRFQDFILGSNAEKIVSHSPVSVLVVRQKG